MPHRGKKPDTIRPADVESCVRVLQAGLKMALEEADSGLAFRRLVGVTVGCERRLSDLLDAVDADFEIEPPEDRKGSKHR